MGSTLPLAPGMSKWVWLASPVNSWLTMALVLEPTVAATFTLPGTTVYMPDVGKVAVV